MADFELICKKEGKAIYRDHDKRVKIFESGYTKDMVMLEAYNQSLIETTNVNAPKMLEVTQINGKWAIISEYIEGTSLDILMEQHPEKYDEYLNILVDTQKEILLTETDRPLRKLKDKMQYKINNSTLDSSTKYELNTRIESTPNHNRICHGSFEPSKVILRQGDNVPFVIDWFHVTQGNASADAARTYLLLCIYDTKEHAEKYLDLFCEKMFEEKAYVQKWIPVVAATQLMKNINSEKEKEILESWVNVCEF